MHNWVKLVEDAVAAEIPDFEIIQTAACFLGDLEDTTIGDDVARRLAKFFGFNPETRLHIKIYLQHTVFYIIKSVGLIMQCVPIILSLFIMPVPEDELLLQLSVVKPVAEGLQRQKSLKPLEAWAKAVARSEPGLTSHHQVLIMIFIFTIISN